MAKIALIADVHLANHRRWGGPLIGGINRRGREAIDVLKRATTYAKDAGCVALFVLGDLFDTSRPSPPLVAAAIDALEQGPKAYIILGNHDRQSQHWRDHACAPMTYAPNIEVVTTNVCYRLGNLYVGCVPYQPGDGSEWLPSAMAEAFPPGGTGRRLLLTHLGIWDDDTPPYLKSARDAVGVGQVRWLCDAHKVSAFVAGNWHQSRHWSPTSNGDALVVIPGTLCPHSFSDESNKGGLHGGVGEMVTYDSDLNTVTAHTIQGPRFFTINSLQAHSVLGRVAAGLADGSWPTYFRLRVPAAELDAARACRDKLENESTFIEIEVVDDTAASSVHEAAAAAIKASDGDLTEDYSELAAVEAPGTRAGVQRRLAEYRKGVG